MLRSPLSSPLRSPMRSPLGLYAVTEDEEVVTGSPGLLFLYAGDSRMEKAVTPYPHSYVITSAVRASNVTTLTFRDAHGIGGGSTQLQAITGLDASFNVPNGATVTGVTATTVTYPNTGADGSSVLTGGKALKLFNFYGESNTPLAWGLAKSEGRAGFIDTGYGKGGLTTTTFLAGNEYVDLKARVTALGGANIFFMLGTNNSNSSIPLATTSAHILQIIDELTALAPDGCVKIYWANETPRESADDALHLSLRDFIDTLPTLRDNVVVVDTWTATAQGPTTNLWKVGYSTDGTHGDAIAAQPAGEALADSIMANIPANEFTVLYMDDNTGVLNPNPTMALGGGGSNSNGWSGVPASWSGTNSGAAGMTFTVTDETRDGIAGKLITLGGQSTTAHPTVSMLGTLDISGLAVGDSVFCAALVQWENLVNIRTVTAEVQAGGITEKVRALDGADDTNLLPEDEADIQLQRTPPFFYSTGVTSIKCGLTIEPGAANTTIGGTIWIAQFTAREYDDTLALPSEGEEPVNYLLDSDGFFILDSDGKNIIVTS